MVDRMLDSREKIEPYMPHSGAMLLLNRVVDHSHQHITAEVDIGSHLPYYADGLVPAYLGVELMAQSIAAWSGILRADPNSRPPIGFLLGARRFQSTLAFYAEGSTLKICARQVIQNNGLAMFECEIEQIDADGAATSVANADVSVYSMPENSNPNQ